jgi:ATP-binding cassette subfamily G (WHITE) protein 2 (PDR)
MYRVSPFTYLVSGVMSVGIANTDVVCADVEYLHFDPIAGMTCYDYLRPYMNATGGYLTDATANATSNCSFCTLSDTNAFLAQVNVYYSDRWRNFGLMWVYIVFNAAGAVFLYWLARVPKNTNKEVKEKKA